MSNAMRLAKIYAEQGNFKAALAYATIAHVEILQAHSVQGDVRATISKLLQHKVSEYEALVEQIREEDGPDDPDRAQDVAEELGKFIKAQTWFDNL